MPESEQETRPQVTLEVKLMLVHLRMNTISPQAQERITRALEPRQAKSIPQELLGIR